MGGYRTNFGILCGGELRVLQMYGVLSPFVPRILVSAIRRLEESVRPLGIEAMRRSFVETEVLYRSERIPTSEIHAAIEAGKSLNDYADEMLSPEQLASLKAMGASDTFGVSSKNCMLMDSVFDSLFDWDKADFFFRSGWFFDNWHPEWENVDDVFSNFHRSLILDLDQERILAFEALALLRVGSQEEKEFNDQIERARDDVREKERALYQSRLKVRGNFLVHYPWNPETGEIRTARDPSGVVEALMSLPMLAIPLADCQKLTTDNLAEFEFYDGRLAKCWWDEVE